MNPIEKLLKFSRPEILKEFRADSCIVSTAIGIDVLNHFNILAEALPVRVMIYNEAFAKRIESGAEFPTTVEEVHQWGDEDGSYNLGIGSICEQQKGKWNGHLIILVENKYLVDLSIDQANREKYKMVFEPFCFPVQESFLKKNYQINAYNKCVFRIERLLNNEYLQSPDWYFKDRRSDTIKRIIKLMGENRA